MEPMDWSASAAWIAFAFSFATAIITPAITQYLSNRHQRRLKELELKNLKEQNYFSCCKTVYEDFVDQASSQLFSIGGNRIGYERSYQKLFLYVPPEYWPALKRLNSDILSRSSQYDNCQSFDKVMEIFGMLLQEQQARIQTKVSKPPSRFC